MSKKKPTFGTLTEKNHYFRDRSAFGTRNLGGFLLLLKRIPGTSDSESEISTTQAKSRISDEKSESRSPGTGGRFRLLLLRRRRRLLPHFAYATMYPPFTSHKSHNQRLGFLLVSVERDPHVLFLGVDPTDEIIQCQRGKDLTGRGFGGG